MNRLVKASTIVPVLAALVFFLGPLRRAEGIIIINNHHAFASIGMVPGQALRVSVANPGESQPNSADRVRVLLYDTAGKLVRDSGEARVASGETYLFEVPREALGERGEPRTGRVQVRAEVLFQKVRPRGEREQKVAPAVEVLEVETGKTVVLNSNPVLVDSSATR